MRFLSAILISGLLPFSAAAATLVHNVRGYTMDDGARVAFVALEFDERGWITRLYREAGELGESRAARRIDGGGAGLLPGLIDAHGHIITYGRALRTVDLAGSASEAEAARRVAAYIGACAGKTGDLAKGMKKKDLEGGSEERAEGSLEKRAERGEEKAERRLDERAEPPLKAETKEGTRWITGRGWNQTLWPGRAFPSAASLDAVAGESAVALRRIDGHALWVNSRALAIAGIDGGTPDPPGGKIIRDETGRATGVLIDNAMQLVEAAIPPETDAELEALAHSAMRNLVRLGLTSVHDAGLSAREARAFQRLRRASRLPLRVYGMLSAADPENAALLKEGPILDSENRLVIRSVKIYADGALGSRGAALFEPYQDAPEQNGLLLSSDAELEDRMSAAMAAGFQVNTHAIGDRANARALDFYAELIPRHGSRRLRHRIEHAQVIRLQDIPRFARLGIIASAQPIHATSDMNMAGARLGEARLAGAYAWKKLLDSGAAMAGGSDFPVEPPNPFYGLHAAVTRQSRGGQPPGGWLPGEKLSRGQALSLFTEQAAWAAHQEAALGRLLPGYAADFILTREDYFAVPAQEIWNIEVLATYVNGELAYQAPQ